jgi:hypothetical protein
MPQPASVNFNDHIPDVNLTPDLQRDDLSAILNVVSRCMMSFLLLYS